MIKRRSSCIDSLSHLLCLRSGDDVTSDYTMHYGTSDCDMSKWKVISNSVDIDFIHGDIPDRSWKNGE